MANNNIAERFTETSYATKLEVKHELRTPLIDTFWKMILSYRKQFEKQIGVMSIERNPITYCLCPSIENHIYDLDGKIYSLSNKFSFVCNDNDDSSGLSLDAIVIILLDVAKHCGIETNADEIKALVLNKTSDEKLAPIKNYYAALNEVIKSMGDSINEDALAGIYYALTKEEITSLYRIKSLEGATDKFIIDPVYSAAPVALLDGFMRDLLNVLNSKEEMPISLKSALAYFYIYYTKPFAHKNEEMAALITKLVLINNDKNKVYANLDIETLMAANKDKVVAAWNEVQKTNDFTYFLDMYCKVISEATDKALSAINNIQANQLKEDYYREDIDEAKQSPLYEEPKEAVEEPVMVENSIVEQVVNEVVEKPVAVEETPANEPTRTYVGLAISNIPTVLDEKEAARLEEDLLESDPELKRSQAYFYARHCTMGKRYTISQFKKELGCAYETARTSMDALAELGYYRQEMVKNKKVYTPIKR